MSAPGNRSHAVRRWLRSVVSWLLRERHVLAFDRVVRRGGGLLVLAVTSFIAGWLLPAPSTLRAYLDGPCFRIAWVARITTGESEELGPMLLVQTEWTRDGARPGPGRGDLCTATKVLLRLPPTPESLYRHQDGSFVPLRDLASRPRPRLPVPAELCLPPTKRDRLCISRDVP